MQMRNLCSKSALSYASSQTGARTLALGGDGVVTDYAARLLVLLWRSAGVMLTSSSPDDLREEVSSVGG